MLPKITWQKGTLSLQNGDGTCKCVRHSVVVTKKRKSRLSEKRIQCTGIIVLADHYRSAFEV